MTPLVKANQSVNLKCPVVFIESEVSILFQGFQWTYTPMSIMPIVKRAKSTDHASSRNLATTHLEGKVTLS